MANVDSLCRCLGVALLAAAACGGDPASGNPDTDARAADSDADIAPDAVPPDAAVPPAAPEPAIAVTGIKQLTLTWAAVATADSYRVLESADGIAAASAVADVTGTSVALDLPLHDRLGATYQVEACNPGGCTASTALPVNAALLDQAIGYFKASNTGVADFFGAEIALSGDGTTMVVGTIQEDSGTTGINTTPNEAQTNAGAAYVYVRTGSTWTQQAYIKASHTTVTSGQTGDAFGYTLALSDDGNTLAVGAPLEDSSTVGINTTPNEAQTNSGAVFVFTRSGGTWTQQAYVKAFNTGQSDSFGIAVSLSDDGNTLAVGAHGEASNSSSPADNSLAFSGAAYAFTRSGATWTQQAYLKSSSPGTNDQFGVSVALSGDGNRLAVGVISEDSDSVGIGGNPVSNAADGSGAVYLFARSGVIWSTDAYVKASNTGAGDRFGQQVALDADGDTLAVTASEEASGSPSNQLDNTVSSAGAVYVYTRSGAIWTQQAYVKSPAIGNDVFGWDASISDDGDHLLVVAFAEAGNGSGLSGDPANNSLSGAGAAYHYVRAGGVWSARAYLKATNTTAGDGLADTIFSGALSGDGRTAAIGSFGEDSSSTGVGGNQAPAVAATDSGAVYLF